MPHKPPLSSIGRSKGRGPVVVEAVRGVIYVLPKGLRDRR